MTFDPSSFAFGDRVTVNQSLFIFNQEGALNLKEETGVIVGFKPSSSNPDVRRAIVGLDKHDRWTEVSLLCLKTIEHCDLNQMLLHENHFVRNAAQARVNVSGEQHNSQSA